VRRAVNAKDLAAAANDSAVRLICPRAQADPFGKRPSPNLHVTHPDANKGHAALASEKIVGVPPEAMACLGDMPTISLLKIAGVSIAMGKAPDSVRAAARFVTGTNDEAGWADTIRHYML
jgi:hydroxymethylpyrimidine pyrophosphatase-like HAD family hydrolase